MAKHKLIRRLLPLYAGVFLQGLVLWYAVEKLFMTSIGFNNATIGVMTAVYATIILFTETPSGILADRWSRKGVMILASVALGVSTLIDGLSTTLAMYIVGSVIWGMFDALFSGTTDAIIYDVLEEERGHSDDYDKYYGFIQFVEGTALVLGALAGGVVGSVYGLREAYFLTIPIALASIVAFALFREPMLHKAKEAEPIVQHVRETLGAVLGRGSVVSVLAVLILGGLVAEVMYEFNQLWFIALALPVVWYGAASAVLYGSGGLGGILVRFVRLDSRMFVTGFGALMAAAGLTLVMARHNVWVVAAQVVLMLGMTALEVVYLHKLHDRLPSRIRAGASSAVSTLTRAAFVVVSLVFGWVAEAYSIFAASWIVVAAIVAMSAFLFMSAGNKKDAI